MQLQKMATIGLILVFNVSDLESAPNLFPEQSFSQIGQEMKNSEISKDTGAWKKESRHTSAVTSFCNFLVDFGEYLSDSLGTSDFVMIEQHTTKLEGGGHNGPTILYCF